MKKVLLLAACAAMFTSALADTTADGYTITKATDVAWPAELPSLDCRQGFGLNNQFYIQNKAKQELQVYDLTGKLVKTIPSSKATGVSFDEAGNIVMSLSTFSNDGGYRTDTVQIKVVSADGKTVKNYKLPTDIEKGRCDFLGCAEGNMLTDGSLYFVGLANTGVGIMRVADGELDVDNSYEAIAAGTTPSSSTVVMPWKPVGSEDMHYLYVTRNATPYDLVMDGENFKVTPITLPNKGANNGAYPFVYGGKNYIAYPTLANYLDGFAVAEITFNADGTISAGDAPVMQVDAVAAANANGFQADWLTVDPSTQTIYQVYPGGGLRTYKFTTPQSTGVNNVTTTKTVKNVTYVNALGMQSAEPFQGMNIVVTNYTDGSHTATKVMK
ncbi:MAG: hypothetical protein SPL48_08760 [Bacteroidales bacterium]|nr:hypothetical protein [Bacteroidales bacterium]